jgi:hypothetical protein
MVLFVYVLHCNTSQSSDRHRGRQLFVYTPGEQSTGVQEIITVFFFTVLCFIAGNGEPVMCAVILESDKESHE